MSEITSGASNPTNFGMSQIEEIDLREIASAIWREKVIVLISIATCLVLATGYLLFKTSQYESDVLIQVQDKQSSIGSNLTQDIANLVGTTSQISSVDVQKALLTSRYILEPVIRQLGLDVTIKPHYLPIFNHLFAHKDSDSLVKPRFGLTKYAWGGEQLAITYLSVPYTYEQKKKALKLVVGNNKTYQVFSPAGELLLEAKVGELAKTKNSHIPAVSIQVESLRANPGTEFFIFKKNTAQLIDKLAKRLRISDLGTSRVGNNTGILQLSYANPKPQQTVAVLNAIANILVVKDTQVKSSEAEKTFEFLQQQLPISKASLDAAETKLNNYRAKSGKLDLKLESQLLLNQFSTLGQNIAELKLQKAQMLREYTSKHPFIAGIDDKIKELEKELAHLQSQIKKLPAADQIAVSLMRDVEVKNQLYMLLLNKIQEIRVVKAGTISDVHILDLAPYPNEPISKKTALVITASLLLGLMLGAGIVLLRRALSKRIEDPYWLEKNLAIDNLAIVPHSKLQETNIKAFKNKTTSSLAILAKEQPQDVAIESLRSLRTAMDLTLSTAENNIVSIIGISPGIGKSFISVNLSQVLADLDKRILLIDGDIRKGYIHHYFQQKSVPGLTELLEGQAAYDDVVYKTTSKNLAILPCGTYAKNPSELLSKKEFKQLLDKASKDYDLIIIDTAPILAVTDGIIIAKHASTNFLVVGAGEHLIQEIDISLKRLKSNQITIQGTIFNNKRASVHTYGSAKYYYSYS